MGQLLKDPVEHGPHTVGRNAPCQQEVWEGPDVDLARLPVQHCWPGDVAPLITWGLTITRAGRARPGRTWASTASRCSRATRSSCAGWPTAAARWTLPTTAPSTPASPTPWPWRWGRPATLLGAVTPVPDSLSEYQFAACCAVRAHRSDCCFRRAAASARHRRDRARRPHPARRPPRQRLAARARRAVWRPHRLLQRMRRVPRAHRGPHHDAPGRDLPQHLHRQTARRARRAGPGNERAVHPLLQKQFPRSWTSTCRPKAAVTAWPWSASARPTQATRAA